MIYNFMRLISVVGECDPKAGAPRFLGLPHWYEYMPGERDALGKCIPSFDWTKTDQLIRLWAIALAIIDIMLRIGALVAVGYIIWGGFQYMSSSGEPDKTKAAKDTILNALIGVIVAILAVAIVSFIGNTLG